jgi:hypothetical protein
MFRRNKTITPRAAPQHGCDEPMSHNDFVAPECGANITG